MTRVWISLCLPAFLAACSTTRVEYVPQERLLKPSPLLYKQTSSPGLQGIETWRDAASRLFDYDAALEQCNADKLAIKAWAEAPRPSAAAAGGVGNNR